MKKWLLLIFAASLFIFPTQSGLAKEANNCGPIKEILKANVKENNGVCQMHISRKQPRVTMMGHALPPNMMDLGLNANFEPFRRNTEVIGEFALLGKEVNPVIDALRKGGIKISAIHNHMIGEFPPIYFLHFEGLGKSEKLAKAVQNAVDKVSYK